jgi:hypothetical protein
MTYERKTVDILVSDELKSILSEIEHDSLVAKILLKKRHSKESLVDDPINYISISTSDNTKISYLTSDRMSKMEESEYWSSSRRFQTKPGSFVSKIFKDIPAKEVEKFSNLYKTFTKKSKFKFEVVSGTDIKKYYRYDSYQNDSGTLGSSCMKHDESQRLLDIYSDNTEQLSMLVMINEDGFLKGRALLWKFNSYKIMDRIYTICDEDYAFWFKKWATDNGYLFKSEQNWYNSLFFENIGGKKQELKLKVSLENKKFEYYPYMDTFKFIDSDCNLYNYQPDGIKFKTLCSTDGTKYGGDYLKFDGIDKVYRYSHESCYLEYLDIFTRSGNCYYSDVNDCYILVKDAVWIREINDYIFNSEYSENNNKKEIQRRHDKYVNRVKDSYSVVTPF